MLRPVLRLQTWKVADMETGLGQAAAQPAGAQRFIIDARASNRHFFEPSIWTVVHRERLCHVEFQGAPEDAQNWFADSDAIKNAFFALPAVIASEVDYAGKTIEHKRLAPDFLVYLVPATLPKGFFLGRCSSVKMSRTTVLSLKVQIRLFLFAVAIPHHCCSPAANLACDRLVSVGPMLTILGLCFAVQTALTFISHVSLQV